MLHKRFALAVFLAILFFPEALLSYHDQSVEVETIQEIRELIFRHQLESVVRPTKHPISAEVVCLEFKNKENPPHEFIDSFTTFSGMNITVGSECDVFEGIVRLKNTGQRAVLFFIGDFKWQDGGSVIVVGGYYEYLQNFVRDEYLITLSADGNWKLKSRLRTYMSIRSNENSRDQSC